jgi:hypothetical protein
VSYAELSTASNKPESWEVGKRYVFTLQAAPARGGIMQCLPEFGHSLLVVAEYHEKATQQGKKPMFLDTVFWDLQKVQGKICPLCRNATLTDCNSQQHGLKCSSGDGRQNLCHVSGLLVSKVWL